MWRYNFLLTHLWFEKPDFSLKAGILFSLKSFSSSQQIVHAITSENLVQPDDPRKTQLLANRYDFSKQYNLRQFSWTRVPKGTQAPSEIEYFP